MFKEKNKMVFPLILGMMGLLSIVGYLATGVPVFIVVSIVFSIGAIGIVLMVTHPM